MPPRKSVHILKGVSPHSTKTEILDAYQKLITQLDTVSVPEEEEEIEREKDRLSLVAKYKDTPIDTILKQLADVKLTTNRAIGEMTEILIEKQQQLSDLTKTIELENDYLTSVEHIKVNVKTLKQLIRVQDQQKEVFEKTMQEQKAAWDDEKRKKERERQIEEEEYQFQMKRIRREEEEAYRIKRQEKEKELKEREIVLKKTEDELDDLRKLKDSFPKELEKAVQEAKKAATITAEREAGIKHQLLEKQTEGEKKLAASQIDNLEQTVKQQQERIRQLELQLAQANDRIKEIAAGAVNIQTQHARDASRSEEERLKK